MPLLPSALPPKGKARRYVANDFLNLIAFPAWGRGTAPAVDRVLSYIVDLRRSSPPLFHAASALSAPSGHLPLEGKAVCRGYRFPPPTSAPSEHLLPKEGGSIHASPFPWKGLLSAARRGWLPFLRRSRLLFPFPIGEGGPRNGARVLSYIDYLRRSPSLSFIPLEPYPPLRGTFPTRGRLCVEDTAFPLQPPPLRGTSFQRKEGASTRAPSLGRGC